MNIFNKQRNISSRIIILTILVGSLLISSYILATPANAQVFPVQLVPCGGTDNPATVGVDESWTCNYCHLFNLAQNIVQFLVAISVFIAVLLFVYAGFLFLTSGGNVAQIAKAKGIFGKVFIGFVIVLAAWLIIDVVMKSFYSGGSTASPGPDPSFMPWDKVCDPTAFPK